MGKIKKGMLLGLGLTLMAKEAVQKETKKQLAVYDLNHKDVERMTRKAAAKGKILKRRIERVLEDAEKNLHSEAKSIAKNALKRGAKAAAKYATKKAIRKVLRRRKN